MEYYKNTALLETLTNKVTKINNGTCIHTAVGLVCSVFAVVFFVAPPALQDTGILITLELINTTVSCRLYQYTYNIPLQ